MKKSMSYPSISLFLSFALVSLLLAGCEKEMVVVSEEEPNQINTRFPKADPELWIYFQRFEEEAAERGLDIDLVAEGISGEIINIDEQQVAGQCNFSSIQPNHLIVDRDFWRKSPPLYKEFIVFHELGHCSLLRDHLEDKTASGICKSLMRSGMEDCRDNYTYQSRETYLDELFLAKGVPSLFDGR